MRVCGSSRRALVAAIAVVLGAAGSAFADVPYHYDGTHPPNDLGGDQVWTWARPPDGGGRIPLPGPPDSVPRWCEGFVRREGDGREVTFAHTWDEVYPARL